VSGAGAQRLEPESVQKVVDGLQAADDAELLLQDAADVPAPQDAHPVRFGRAGPHPFPESVLLVGGERGLPPTPGEVGQGVRAAGVVPADPGADLALGQEYLGGDLRGGPAEQGQPDGRQPASNLRPGLGADAFGESVGGVVRLDVHGGLLPG
jgi:hypothetical protein